MAQMAIEYLPGENKMFGNGPNHQSISESSASFRRNGQSSDINVSLDSSRHAVNTHNSILDLSRDFDEDDDDVERSVMFDDLAAVSVDNDEDDQPAVVEKKFSLNSFLGDTFMDGLCTAEIVPEPCVVPTDCSASRLNCTKNSNRRRRGRGCKQDRLMVGTEIWDLLGCAADPGAHEKDEIWSRRVDLSRPCRANIKNRMNRIRRLRSCSNSNLTATRHGITLSSNENESFRASPMGRARTMDLHEDLSTYIGHGVDPIPMDYDGYDSDPEVLSPESKKPRVSRAATQESVPLIPNDSFEEDLGDEFDGEVDEDSFIRDLVQQTLNSTWTFTWHPNPHNVKEFGLESSKPICVNIWIERGTALPNGHVAEPTIMWRDAYQPHLLGKHQLNKSTQKPWTMRLLNTCRIAALGSLDRTVYPMARSQNCFVLKTSTGNHEFLFEAQSNEDLETVCERWKLTVARFASLAVMEDIGTIEQEFFHPTTSSQMLTVDEY